MTLEEIAEEHHLATYKHGTRSRARRSNKDEGFVNVPVPVWEEAKRAHRAGYPTLTAYLMGDPLLGRSALDLRNQHAPA